MQAIGVLGRIDAFEHSIFIEVFWQRKLNDVSGAVGIIVEPLDGRANICLRGIGWQVFAD